MAQPQGVTQRILTLRRRWGPSIVPSWPPGVIHQDMDEMSLLVLEHVWSNSAFPRSSVRCAVLCCDVLFREVIFVCFNLIPLFLQETW